MASASSRQIEESYDDVTYRGAAVQSTHPSHLAMVARLCGLSPPSPKGCRVLELGCAVGSNLIPMAADLPNSRFVGIDLSARQIEEGRATISEHGLVNIELLHKSISDVGPDMGKFDYILCYGVYSWVPEDVQKRYWTSAFILP